MKCILKPISSVEKLSPLELEDGIPKVIGRSEETNITNKRCSKKQVSLTADYATKTVKISQTGSNHSGINGSRIGMGATETAKTGDVLELLLGELRYKIHFRGEDDDEDDATKSPPKKLAKIFEKSSPTDAFKKDSSLTKGVWTTIGNNEYLVYSLGETIKAPKQLVASFDLDGTIITTKSGKVFPKDKNDWKFLYPTTIDCLRRFFQKKDDFKFVIFTNQAGCKNQVLIDEMKLKIETITGQIGIPVLVFIAPNQNKYRKPLTAGWKTFVEDYNGGVVPDLKESFYCGDAAGRKKDHSKSDRFFALNIGITFKLPEEVFLDSRKVQEFEDPVFDPKIYMSKSPPNNRHIKFSDGVQEMIVMIGYPGSGKSSFVKSVILPKGFVHVNRDTLKTQAKCLSVADNALMNGQSVVVDNTNPEKKDRAEYVKLAKKHNVPVRCFKMNVDHAHALHNNKFRGLTNNTGVSVPTVAYNTFKSRFQEPTSDEGFGEILSVNFVPNFDSSPEDERDFKMNLYCSYLLEK